MSEQMTAPQDIRQSPPVGGFVHEDESNRTLQKLDQVQPNPEYREQPDTLLSGWLGRDHPRGRWDEH